MCDLICDVISYCARSCGMDKINVYDKIMTVNQKRENMEIKKRKVYIILDPMDGLGMEFTAC